MADKPITQNHWGSGHNINAQTVNFGPQRYEMNTPDMASMANDLRRLGEKKIFINAAHDQHSIHAGEILVAFLKANGFDTDFNSIVMSGEILRCPVTIRDGESSIIIHVDTTVPHG